MKTINKVILLGRLGADPIRRETKNGMAVVHFPLATSRFTTVDQAGADAGKKEETLWHQVVVWGKLGEACAKNVKKGQALYVEGSFRSHKYEGKDGATHTAFEVHAYDVSFFFGVRKRAESGHDAGIEEGGAGEAFQEAI